MSDEEKIDGLRGWLKERNLNWENLSVPGQLFSTPDENRRTRDGLLKMFLDGHPLLVERWENLGALGVGTSTQIRALPKR